MVTEGDVAAGWLSWLRVGIARGKTGFVSIESNELNSVWLLSPKSLSLPAPVPNDTGSGFGGASGVKITRCQE